MLYLTADVRHDPTTTNNPPYQMFLLWCATNGIPIFAGPGNIGWTLHVYNEAPVRAVLDVIDLDENNQWVLDPETSQPVTHEVTYNPAGLPPVSGHMIRPS